MARPQTDYVLQHTQEIEKLLREAGSGRIDSEVEKLIKIIEKKHGELNDIGKHRRWSESRYELANAGRKLIAKIPEEIREFRKAREYIRSHNGSTLRIAMLERVTTKLTFTRSRLERSITGLTRMGLPSAGFEGRELNPAAFEPYFTLRHPGKSAGGMPPATFRFTGPAGSEVTIEMEHVRGLTYGGHGHAIAPEHLGTFRNRNARSFKVFSAGKLRFQLRDEGETSVQYLASDLCTRRKFTVTQLWRGAGMRHGLFVDVRYAKKLYDLNQYDLKYMKLYTGDGTHPDSVCHYGSKEMIEALQSLNHSYGRALESGEFDEATTTVGDPLALTVTYRRPKQTKILVNDLSLPWGGRFKFEGKQKKKGHSSHKWGNDVDISINPTNGITALQANWLRRRGQEIMGVQPLDEGDHLHFRVQQN